MFDNFYVNPVYWVLAVAGVIGWARFATWIAKDVQDIPDQSELMWKLVGPAVLLLMVLIWVVMPSFWIALPVNLLIVSGVVGGYWMIRVKALGAEGNLFRGAFKGVNKATAKRAQNRAAKSMLLTYLKKDDTPLPLPGADDPMHVGLAFADEMVVQALERRSEGLELVPAANGYDLKFTVDGVGLQQAPMARNVAESAIQAIKSIAGLTIEERRRPQEGTFKVRDSSGIATKWTVRTSGSTAGEKLSLSANEQSQWKLTLDQVGMNAEQLAAMRTLKGELQGVVIVATPRQTGRTTTLYALVRQHDAFTTSVHTLETNPQTELEGVTANRFDTRNVETSYSKTLQSIMLKDPGVLMSAQCPDAPSAQTLAKFGLSEHRVYIGMQAFDTMAALEIWLQMVPDKQLAVKSLRAIVSQRLVRVLCPTCKIPYQPDEATLRKLNLPVGRNLQSFKANTEGIVDAKGNRTQCPDCGSLGYRGRTGIFEILLMTDEMRKEIVAGASLKQVQATARKNNMSLLVEHGIRKFASGLTSIQEVLRVVAPDKSASPSAASGVMQAQK